MKTEKTLRDFIEELIFVVIFFGIPMFLIFRDLYKELALYGG